jgi:RNA methyltransferase, TrmH family
VETPYNRLSGKGKRQQMPYRIVHSSQNARLKELRRALRDPAPPALASDNGGAVIGPLVGVEGYRLIAETLRAGLRIHCVFAAHGAEKLVQDLNLPPDVEVLLLPRELLNAALSTETPQPVAALVTPPRWDWETILGPDPTSSSLPRSQKRDRGHPLILVLAGLQDPGNLGTILRSVEAFGATGIVTLPGTVSPWNPKVVRASAGSVFRVPLVAAGADECFERLRRAGVKLWTTAARDAEPVNQADLTAPAALLIGNEGNGVPPELAARAQRRLTVPCPGPVESLNAAVAASVLLYEISRQRSGERGGGPNPISVSTSIPHGTIDAGERAVQDKAPRPRRAR